MNYTISLDEGFDAAGFEVFSIAVQGDYGYPPVSWGVYPELTTGYWAMVSVNWEGSLKFPTDDPVDGDRYVFYDGAGDMDYTMSVGLLSYGDPWTLTYGTAEFPPSGAVEEGDTVEFRFAHKSRTTLEMIANFAWLDSDGLVVGDVEEFDCTDLIASDMAWKVFRTSGIETIGAIDSSVIGSGLVAPSGVAAFSLRLDWRGFAFGAADGGFDAIAFKVGTPTTSALFDTYPTGFRFPYNWRRSA